MFLLLFLAISCNQVDCFLKKKELIINIEKYMVVRNSNYTVPPAITSSTARIELKKLLESKIEFNLTLQADL
jgi:hypothetical protein